MSLDDSVTYVPGWFKKKDILRQSPMTHSRYLGAIRESHIGMELRMVPEGGCRQCGSRLWRAAGGEGCSKDDGWPGLHVGIPCLHRFSGAEDRSRMSSIQNASWPAPDSSLMLMRTMSVSAPPVRESGILTLCQRLGTYAPSAMKAGSSTLTLGMSSLSEASLK